MAATDATQITCRNCGALDTGSYCSACGATLSSAPAGAWLHFADSFVKAKERAAYVRTYLRILASPTRNTIALYAEHNSSRAFQFLQTSLLIYTLVVLSRTFGGDTILTEIAFPIILLISQVMYLAMFYWLAHRKSRSGRSSREYLIVAAYTTGFTLPILSVPQWLQIIAPGLGALAVLVVCIPLYVYLLRVWADFWALTKRRVFCYLLATALTNTVIWIAVGIGIALLFLVPSSA